MTDHRPEPTPDRQRRRSTDAIPFLNGWAYRAESIAKFVNNIAIGPLVIVTMVVLVIGGAFGYVKNPLSSIEAAIVKHDEHSIAGDLELNRTLALLRNELERQRQNSEMRACMETYIRDPTAQRRCLESFR